MYLDQILDGYSAVAFEETQHFQDKFMDADDIMLEVNDRF